MKNRLTKSFLWSIVVIEIIILLIVLVLYTASNQKTLNFIAKKVTTELNISYEHISGSLLDSISLQNITYNQENMADEVTIAWSFKTLFSSNILINRVKLQNINIDTIQKLIDSFHIKKDNTVKKKSFPLPNLEIKDIDLSLVPYQNKFISLYMLKLHTEKLKIDKNQISLKSYNLSTKSNIANIYSKGFFKDNNLNITTLNIDEININNIKNIISNLSNKNSTSETSFKLFSQLLIKNLTLETLPFDIGNNSIYKITLHSTEFRADIDSLLLNTKGLSLTLKTDIANLQATGLIKNNNLISNLNINLMPEYFKNKIKDINFKNFNPINIKLYANQNIADANISLKSKNVFQGRFARCNNIINSFKSRVHFDIQTKKLEAFTDANVSTRYANSLILKDHLTYKSKLNYQGSIDISQLKHFPNYSLEIFKNAKILYKADEANLTAHLNTDELHLLYKMYNYKRADFYLDSKELNITKYFPSIPKALNNLKARVNASMNLDFKNPKKLYIDTNISSNAIDLKGKIYFKNGVNADAKTTLSQNTILKNIDKNLKLDKIFPSTFKLKYKNKILNIINQNKNLKSQLLYDLNTTKIDFITNISNNNFKVSGDAKKLIFNTKVLSLKEFQKSLNKIYALNITPLDGELEINSTISNLSEFKTDIKSKWLVYEYDTNKFAFAEKIKLHLNVNESNITIKDYNLLAFIYGDSRVLYSKVPSHINFTKHKITLNNLWINDELKIKGSYELEKSKGNFIAKSSSFHYKGKEGDLKLKISLTALINKARSSISGDLKVLDGLVSYKYRNMHDVQDPDIIIIQDQKRYTDEKSKKSNKLSVNISLTSTKPIKYKVKDIDINLQPDLKFWKEENKNLELLGRVAILDGNYIQSEKEFKILPSELLFGGDILNPYLNIKAKYFSDPYDISIDISGKVDTPIVNFTSSPYLSQSDILSILLFNSTTSSLLQDNTSTSNKAISFFGNTFAKEIVKKFGIKLDKLVILTNEDGGFGVEVGKKISKKVTVIYINDIVQTIKIKYLHSNKFESDITLSPESSGIDFIYKREY